MTEAASERLQILNGFLRSRRTVNYFTDEAVDARHIEAAVRAARWAPNHRLTEPWQFFHMGPNARAATIELAVQTAIRAKGPEAGEARRERLLGVPEWLLITSARSSDALRDREDYAATCCAAQNLLLYLSGAGLGCKWTTGAVTRDPALLALVGLDPDLHRVVGLFWIGHPKLIPESRRSHIDQVFHRLP